MDRVRMFDVSLTLRLNLIQLIQRASDDNLPLSFWKGGKAKTAEAVMAQSVDVDDLRFPSALGVGGVIAA